MEGQFDMRATAAGQMAGTAAIGGGISAPQNKISISRSAGNAQRLHDLVDTLEKFLHGSHSHLDRVAGSVPEPAASPQYGNGIAQAPPADSQMHRLEQGLQRFEALLQSEAARLFQRLSEL